MAHAYYYITYTLLTLFLHAGLLQQVDDIQKKLANGTLCLSWVLPFTLNITNVHPDILNLVEVMNVTDAANSFIIPCDNCPLATPEYKFTVVNPSTCDKFTFVVVPVNGAGIGTPSEPLLGSFFEGSTCIPVSEACMSNSSHLVCIICWAHFVIMIIYKLCIILKSVCNLINWCTIM